MAYFDDRSIRRISKAVVNSERQARQLRNGAATWKRVGGAIAAIITASDGNSNMYSWQALSPDDAGAYSVNTDWGEGNYADDTTIRAVELTGCIDVIWQTKVELVPVPGQNLYRFDYDGGIIPVTIDTFTPNGSGLATVQGTSQQVHYTDLSGGTVEPGSSAALTYQRGSPSGWVLDLVACP